MTEVRHIIHELNLIRLQAQSLQDKAAGLIRKLEDVSTSSISPKHDPFDDEIAKIILMRDQKRIKP